VWRYLINGSQEPPDFIRVEDPRRKAWPLQGTRRMRRQLDKDAVPLEEASELANHGDAYGLGLRTLMRGSRQPRVQERPWQRSLVMAALDEVTIKPLHHALLGGVAIPHRALLEDEVPQPRRKGGLEG